MTAYNILQLYWWAIISLLGALLVFLMFVQGGQTLLLTTAKNEAQKNLILRMFGHKWEITFTTLVTFGGAAFASFPLFYSTSFGGAYWLWILILLVFVLQAFSYEFRNKEHNILGKKTYDAFLFINGLLGTILLGAAVGTFFTGGNYIVDKMNIAMPSANVISYWTNDLKGLELILNPFNILLGVTVLFAARTLGLLFTINQCKKIAVADEDENAESLVSRASTQLKVSGIAFVILFVVFLLELFMMTGYKDDGTGLIVAQKYAYYHTVIQMPWIGIVLIIGVLLVLAGLLKKHFYITGAGVVLAVFAVLLCAGFNNAAYFHSLSDVQCSLTLSNSCSSFYTLKVMSWVSIAIPFVVWYIAYVWRKMTIGK